MSGHARQGPPPLGAFDALVGSSRTHSPKPAPASAPAPAPTAKKTLLPSPAPSPSPSPSPLETRYQPPRYPGFDDARLHDDRLHDARLHGARLHEHLPSPATTRTASTTATTRRFTPAERHGLLPPSPSSGATPDGLTTHLGSAFVAASTPDKTSAHTAGTQAQAAPRHTRETTNTEQGPAPNILPRKMTLSIVESVAGFGPWFFCNLITISRLVLTLLALAVLACTAGWLLSASRILVAGAGNTLASIQTIACQLAGTGCDLDIINGKAEEPPGASGGRTSEAPSFFVPDLAVTTFVKGVGLNLRHLQDFGPVDVAMPWVQQSCGTLGPWVQLADVLVTVRERVNSALGRFGAHLQPPRDFLAAIIQAESTDDGFLVWAWQELFGLLSSRHAASRKRKLVESIKELALGAFELETELKAVERILLKSDLGTAVDGLCLLPLAQRPDGTRQDPASIATASCLQAAELLKEIQLVADRIEAALHQFGTLQQQLKQHIDRFEAEPDWLTLSHCNDFAGVLEDVPRPLRDSLFLGQSW